MQASAARGVFLRQRLRVLVLAAALPVALAGCAGGMGGDGAAQGGGARRSAMVAGSSASGAYLAGRFAQAHNDPSAASHFLLKALKADPENVELLQRTSLALAADGHLPEAAVLSRRLLQFDSEAALAAMLVAEQEARAGNWANAEELVAKLPRRGITTAIVPLITAWSRFGQGRVDAALEALQPLSQQSSYSMLHDFHAALINDLADRRKAAEENFRGTMAGNARLPLRSIEAALSFYRRTNQPDKVKELVERTRADHGDAVDMLLAEPPQRIVDGPRSGLAEAYFSGAVTLRQGGANDLALIFGRMALDLTPGLPGCQVLVADILQGMGRLKEANALFATVDPKSSLYWSTQLRLAANLDALGDLDGAIKALEALSTQHPERPDPLITMGDLERSHQHWAEAATAYGRALATFPKLEKDDWSLLYSRGIAYERSGQWTLAESDFLKALELQPDEPHVLNYLGYTWIDKGMNLDKAQKMIERAVEQLPTDGDIIDSLGWAFYRTGHYAKAVETLQRAVELHPEESTINEHLGDALWLVGRKEEARYQWQRALTFNPEPDQKVALEQKLKSGLKPPVPVK
ncbi:MAG TPA: tetratricopeptide repeat protein [Candidatus Sulfotelmatobacter sp.]|jgi:tetratricopeptide (TPR) repeat protein|nr:tetratricopeptide repeat protein [Candidatus Sulfotelmatobacter sp.]